MTKFDKQKLTELVLYVLNKTGGLGYYHVFKILYFANAKLLATYGVRLTTDRFCALPDGPVPTMLYDCIKGGNECDAELRSMINAAVARGYDDAAYMLCPKREPDMDYFSKADLQVLDESINENASLGYGQLREKSHGSAWQLAFTHGKGVKVMDEADIARDAMASEDMVEYVSQNVALQNAMS